MSDLLVIFQRLAVEWGRKGRSALLTARRRELPKSYPLLLSPVPAGVVAVAQNVAWTDEDGFLHATETVQPFETFTGFQPSEVQVKAGNTVESVELVATPLLGIPNVAPRLRLGMGQVARFEWNEHLGTDDTGEGRVRHTIISVALSPRTVNRDLFSKLPDLYYSHCIDLNQRRLKAGGTG